jgi:hypothetical protein
MSTPNISQTASLKQMIIAKFMHSQQEKLQERVSDASQKYDFDFEQETPAQKVRPTFGYQALKPADVHDIYKPKVAFETLGKMAKLNPIAYHDIRQSISTSFDTFVDDGR